MFRGLVFVSCITGCLKEPEFRGGPRDAAIDAALDAAIDAPDASNPLQCAPGLTELVVTRTGANMQGANVCGPGFQMVFSDIGAKFPYQLNVGGSLLMGNAAVCNEERGTGVAIYPAGLVNGEPHGGAAGMLSVELDGPAVAKIVINWSQVYTCQQQGTLQDRTSFTFFPDGRITRWDRLRHTDSVAGSNCTVCSGGSQISNPNLVVTSYMTLMAPSGSQLLGGAIETMDEIGEEAMPGATACLRTLGQQVAFGWRNTSTRIRVANTTPVRTLAFIQDVFSGTPLATLTEEVTTQLMVSSPVQCADLRMRVGQHAAGTGLLVNGTPLGPSPDGIYGGERADLDEAYDPEVGPVTLTTATTIPGSFAIWLDFGAQENGNVQVTHSNPPSGAWYQIQRVSSSQVIFWFRDDLVNGETITITPG